MEGKPRPKIDASRAILLAGGPIPSFEFTRVLGLSPEGLKGRPDDEKDEKDSDMTDHVCPTRSQSYRDNPSFHVHSRCCTNQPLTGKEPHHASRPN
jgi:hypothetical protein